MPLDLEANTLVNGVEADSRVIPRRNHGSLEG